MNLTPHFTLTELRGTGAPSTIQANLKRTAEFAEVVRSRLGVPLRVTSGYRSAAYNASVGGSNTSAHVQGLAMDVVPVGLTLFGAYSKLNANTLPTFDQIILYPVQGHMHLAVGPGSRREIRIALKGDDGTQYPTVTARLLSLLPGYKAPASDPGSVPSSVVAPLVTDFRPFALALAAVLAFFLTD